MILTDLPDDCLSTVYTFIPEDEWRNLTLVCKRFSTYYGKTILPFQNISSDDNFINSCEKGYIESIKNTKYNISSKLLNRSIICANSLLMIKYLIKQNKRDICCLTIFKAFSENCRKNRREMIDYLYKYMLYIRNKFTDKEIRRRKTINIFDTCASIEYHIYHKFFIVACKYGYIDIVDDFMKKEYTYILGKNILLPLALKNACHNNQLEIIKYLYSHILNYDKLYKTDICQEIFEKACRKKYVDIARFLLKDRTYTSQKRCVYIMIQKINGINE